MSEQALSEGEREALWLCVCGHDSGGEHNGSGCYGRLSYEPLVVCSCKRTDADYEDSVYTAVETIIAARLAPIEALADRWAQEARERGDDDQVLTAGVADMLRAALTAVRANLPVVDGADGGGDRG